VQFAGFEVSQQVFAAVNNVSDGILEDTISGLLGLAFQTIASSGATPLVESLAQQANALDEPSFGFFLTRFDDVLTSQDNAAQFGGQFSLGTSNTSLYTGDIDFVNIPEGRETFWTLEMTELDVNNQSVPITAGEQFAAIDTGTTLIGGPADMIANVFAQIPGSQQGTGDLEGYFTYPCSTQVTLSLTFGSLTWPISPSDFEMMQTDKDTCVGSLFAIDLGGQDSPSWIVGDTFLKNVYSVFRFTPPSVGFAQLSPQALALNTPGEPLPIHTVAANPVQATPGSTFKGSKSIPKVGAAPRAASTGTTLAVILPALAVVVALLI